MNDISLWEKIRYIGTTRKIVDYYIVNNILTIIFKSNQSLHEVSFKTNREEIQPHLYLLQFYKGYEDAN